MSPITYPSFGNVLREVNATFNSFTSEWSNHLVTKIKLSLPHLQHPHIAGGFLFVANFGVLELSYRIAQLAGVFLPGRTGLHSELIEKEIMSIEQSIVIIGLTCAANVALIQATGITLNSAVIVGVVMSSFIAKTAMQMYIENN